MINWKKILQAFYGLLTIWLAVNSFIHNAAVKFGDWLEIFHYQFEYTDKGWDLYYDILDITVLFWGMKLVMIVSGLLLIFDKWAPVFLVVLFPVILSMLLFTIFASPNYLWFTAILMVWHLGLMRMHSGRYKNYFKMGS